MMIVANTPGAAKRVGRMSWRFQQAFRTPLDRLNLFAAVIVSSHSAMTEASLIVVREVFNPKNLEALLGSGALSDVGRDCCVRASSRQEAELLLRAGLADWLDFLFVPTPRPFIIYADHDEYATFYANSKSHMNKVTEPLLKAGFEQVPGYRRDDWG